MRFLTIPILILVAVAAFFAATGGVEAAPASATTHLNVRSGPGAGFSVIDTLDPGEVVDMTECQASGWCYITHAGPSGWVSSTYLTAVPGAGVPDPGCRFNLVITADGPRFSITCGDGSGGAGAGAGGAAPPAGTNQVCFYDDPNYTGAGFCRGPVLLNSLPADADDRITSVLINGAVEVRLCQDINLGGYCRVVSNSEGQLGGLLNNRVSSLQVFAGAAPPPPPAGNRACFYDLPNFGGENFCRGVVTLNNLPTDADDRITSVQITGAVQVRLCRDPNLGGFCRVVTASENVLGGFLNNEVSSLQVFIP